MWGYRFASYPRVQLLSALSRELDRPGHSHSRRGTGSVVWIEHGPSGLSLTLDSMVNVSLTTFVDFAAATGTSRLTKVREAKRFYEQGYAPERDYYKPLRDRIVECFAKGWDKQKLVELLTDIDDSKKLANYEACRRGLTKWAGKKSFTPTTAKSTKWRSGDLVVGISPELWSRIDGEPFVIKLHFKGDPLSQQKANLVLHLMKKKLGDHGTVGVLDVRRSKLFVQTRSIPDLDALLTSEALAFTALWRAV